LKEEILLKRGAMLTAREISGQAKIWKNLSEDFENVSDGIEFFLQSAYAEANSIILTGAGTSAFIGLSLQGVFFRKTGIITRAIATTDIVSHPQDFFNAHQIPLIISFARSGNSPESCATIELADQFSNKCFHLIITCDKNGALAHCESSNPTYIFVLPEEANDKSLAMTGSYSGMLLTGLMIAYIQKKGKIKEQVHLLTQAAETIFSSYSAMLEKIAEKDFKRAFFIGSGGLFGTATEAALKLQELTDGRIVCKTDTFLGLRHGPKAVIDESTLVIYFLSNDGYARRYELDLINSMGKGNLTMFQLGVSENFEKISNLDAQVNFGNGLQSISEDFLPVCAIITGQLIGFYKSLQLGLNPDAPSVNGSISRVVQGVNIYPFENENDLVSGR
jgi:tagatose-6-phosphate ketose/aldose isomerase